MPSDDLPGDAWLLRHSSAEWLELAMQELARAEDGFRQRNSQGGSVACKRAAGMALNGALRVVPNEGWGRTYVEHLVGLSRESNIPDQVVVAATRLLQGDSGSIGLITLWTRNQADQLLDACRTVMAHAYAVVHGSAGRAGQSDR